jgi:hypothetical protein
MTTLTKITWILLLNLCMWQSNQTLAQTYCNAFGNCTGFDYINKVTLADMSNSSACLDADYSTTVLPANLNVGVASTITLTRFNPGGANIFAAVWIDWNHNGDFEDDANEKVGTFQGAGNYSGTVTPPAGAFIGITKMRIRLQGTTPPTSSCGAGGYEVEDYDINITSCNANYTVTAPFTSPVRTTVGATKECGFSSAGDHLYAITIPYQSDWTFSVCSPSTDFDTEIHLGSSCCANGLATNNDDGGTCGTASSITQNLTAGTYYLTVEGNGNAEGDYELDVYSNSLTYCTPTNTDCGFDYITNFTLTDINNNSDCGADYDDFTNLIANLAVGETYNGSAKKDDILPNYTLDLWIDWNQNGTLEETERIRATATGPSDYSFVVNVPTNAKSGNTRIRVRMIQNGVSDPCGTADRGDVEDYTANIIAPPPSCAGNTAPATEATGICKNTLMSWSAPITGSTPTGYKVYFGTATNPPYVATKTGTSYNPGPLLPNISYFWKVVPFNGSGDATGCVENKFTTTDLKASLTPDPANVCVDGPIQFDGGPAGGGATYTHAWTGAGAAYLDATTTQNPIFTATASGNFSLIYTVTDDNGCKANDNVVVIADGSDDPTVTIAITTGSNPTCAGEEITFTSTITNGGSAPTYNWILNGSSVGTAATYTSTTFTDGDEITCDLVSNANCITTTTANSDLITLVVNPTKTPSLLIDLTDGNNPTCEGESLTFTATPDNGGSNPTYEWFVNTSSVGVGATYSTVFQDDDIISCTLTSNETCTSPTTISSTEITVTVNKNEVPTVEIEITSGTNPACDGATLEFTATPTYGGANPIYDWKINGASVGTSAIYSTSNIAENDVVSCILSSDYMCLSQSTSSSNEINMTITPSVIPTITTDVTSGGTEICEGDEIEFTALGTNEGSTPNYQWQVNGDDIFTGTVFTTSSLENGDQVTCVLTSSKTCAVPEQVTSDPIDILVNPATLPAIQIDLTSGNNTVCENSPATFIATVTDEGDSPIYEWFINQDAVGSNPTLTSSSLVTDDEVRCVLTSNAMCASNPTPTSNIIQVVSLPVPSKPVIAQNSLKLTSSASTGNQWYQDGILIPSATDQVLNVLENGTYTVEVTDNGCTSDLSNPIIVGTVGMNELTITNAFKVAPNPSTGLFSVSYIYYDSTHDLTVRVYNSVGSLIREQQMTTSEFEINLLNEVAGVYILKINTVDFTITKRLIKQ